MIYVNHNRQMKPEEWNEMLEKLGLKEKLLNASSVVIKPNFASGTQADPERHVISDLHFLAKVICCVMDMNPSVEVYIAEGDSTGYGFAYAKFEHLGLPESLGLSAEKMERVKLLDLTRDRLQQFESKQLRYFKNVDKQLWLAGTLLNADFVISLSNLKTHSVTGYTGACKNLFGCLPAFDKSVYHTHIHKIVHDVTLAIKPELSIVDSFYGMERNGPCQGWDVDAGYRVCSESPAEADYYAAQTVGLKPFSVKYIKYLFKTEEIEERADLHTDVVWKFKKPQIFLRVMNSIGLGFQRVGENIALFGHRIHTSYNLFILLIIIFRPLLLAVFGRERLQKIKRKLLK